MAQSPLLLPAWQPQCSPFNIPRGASATLLKRVLPFHIWNNKRKTKPVFWLCFRAVVNKISWTLGILSWRCTYKIPNRVHFYTYCNCPGSKKGTWPPFPSLNPVPQNSRSTFSPIPLLLFSLYLTNMSHLAWFWSVLGLQRARREITMTWFISHMYSTLEELYYTRL